MSYKFTKMQGLGNDFILFDEILKHAESHRMKLTPELAVHLCDRRFGIGADGVFILRTAANQEIADIVWEFYNSDGSVAEMCGNAIRCVARYVFDRGLWPLVGDKNQEADTEACTFLPYGKLRVETLAGVKSISLEFDDAGHFYGARVDMGIAELDSDVEVNGRIYSRVSMGNPHAVTFVDSLLDEFGAAPVSTEGPVVEVDPAFPHKTNVEFAHIENRKLIHMRVWERGAGETLACGTGACATAVAAHVKGLVDDQVVVNLLGGPLIIDIDADYRVHMTGPATEVFSGTIELD